MKKMCHVSARRLSIYNFAWELLKATKKVYLIPQKNKDTYGIYPTKFASSNQQHKKVIEKPNQPIEIKKISNKSMFSTSNLKRRQKFVWGLPDES
jgi:predicted nucleic acid-binding protein